MTQAEFLAAVEVTLHDHEPETWNWVRYSNPDDIARLLRIVKRLRGALEMRKADNMQAGFETVAAAALDYNGS